MVGLFAELVTVTASRFFVETKRILGQGARAVLLRTRRYKAPFFSRRSDWDWLILRPARASNGRHKRTVSVGDATVLTRDNERQQRAVLDDRWATTTQLAAAWPHLQRTCRDSWLAVSYIMEAGGRRRLGVNYTNLSLDGLTASLHRRHR